jgi:hypothetical protein
MCFLQLVHDILKGGLVLLVIVRPDPWRSTLQVNGEDGLRSIDLKKGVKLVAQLRVLLKL